MSKPLRYATGLALWFIWTVPVAFSGLDLNLNAPGSPPSFEGKLLRIKGDRYVVDVATGVEREVRVGWNTEGFGPFGKASPGDRIQLWVQPNGHVETMIVVRSRRR